MRDAHSARVKFSEVPSDCPGLIVFLLYAEPALSLSEAHSECRAVGSNLGV